jgi:co-chaperonin GroES (HSP10)
MTKLSDLKPPTALLDQSLDDAFPDVDPGEIPLGSTVLVQVKRAATRTKAGLVLSASDQATEFDNTKVAKVLALGPLAYHTRDDMRLWPEGAWVKPGDYVRLSQHNVRGWTVPMPGTRGATVEDRITFGYIDDLLITGIVKDPMATRAFF